MIVNEGLCDSSLLLQTSTIANNNVIDVDVTPAKPRRSARNALPVLASIKIEDASKGNYKCPRGCLIAIPTSDRGCNVITCRGHSDHQSASNPFCHPKYIYFCVHCKTECADGYSTCSCPKGKSKEIRQRVLDDKNAYNRSNPITFLSEARLAAVEKEAKRIAAEAEARTKAEEEEAKLGAEEEARAKADAEEEAKRIAAETEAEAKTKAEEEEEQQYDGMADHAHAVAANNTTAEEQLPSINQEQTRLPIADATRNASSNKPPVGEKKKMTAQSDHEKHNDYLDTLVQESIDEVNKRSFGSHAVQHQQVQQEMVISSDKENEFIVVMKGGIRCRRRLRTKTTTTQINPARKWG